MSSHVAKRTDSKSEPPLAQRLRSEVERAIQRNLKGFEYLGSPAPAVGTCAYTPSTQR